MKLIADSSEFAEALASLPALIQNKGANWQVFTGLGFSLHCDLLYFDVIDFPMIARLPEILSALNEEKCFIFNFEKLNEPNSGPAIEISSNSDHDEILRKLDASNLDKEDFWTSFYLVPRFGIIPQSADWIILAECDEKAVFLCSHELKYSAFNKFWWSFASDRENAQAGSTG